MRAIEVMREDRRVRAGFMMDGPVPRSARNTRFDRPIILVRSDNAAIGELVGPSWRYFAQGLGLVAHHLELSPALRTSLLLGPIDARRAVALQRSYLGCE
jgi:hypothetical protein